MEGYDENWSDWQLRTSSDFTNLNEGDYVFKVRAKIFMELLQRS